MTETSPHLPIVEWPDVRVKMPDGVELSLRIWMPEDAAANPVPAILEHLPYRKRDGTIARDEVTHPYFASRGYACIRVDMRGNGDSQGLMYDEYEQQEWNDALSVMDWARAQKWCNGLWGMMGISWGGFNCLQLAALQPEGMKAVISLCSTTDRYSDDIHYKGGCMLGENLGWAAQMLAYSSRPPDPDVVGEGWREMWLERLEAQPFLLEPWLTHQTRDGYWQHGSICEDYEALDAAVLSIGGWHDGYRNTPALLVENISAPVKAIVGPWNHKYPHLAGPEPRIGFLTEALRWWDRWLKAAPTGVENDPAQRLYVMDSICPERWVKTRPGRWIGLQKPLDLTRRYLCASRRLRNADDSFEIDLLSPEQCGATGGEYFPFAFGPELPADQTPDDALSLCFDGDALTEDTELIGAPIVRIGLVPKGTVGQIAIRLCDLRPDGTSGLIAHGFLNLTHRDSHARPQALVPGEAIEVSVKLDQCAYRLPAGHRLRVAISTAFWPFIWPASQNAGITVTGGHIDLPMRSAESGDTIALPMPDETTGWKHSVLRSATMERRHWQEDDGSIVTQIDVDNGEQRDDIHGLTTGAKSRETWRIRADDPTSATAEISWVNTMSRGDWSVRTESIASLSADKTHWHPKAELRAYEGETLVFSKSFKSMIARDGT